jgi:hypothetical protein
MTAYRLYRGSAGPDSVDYACPVASAQAGSVQLANLEHLPGRAYWYAARAVADGVEETNTHVLAPVLIDAVGMLLPPLPVPGGLTARAVPGGAEASFTVDLAPGQLPPTRAEVFGGPSAGALDLQRPLASVRLGGPWPSLVRLRVACAPPCVLVVRACGHQSAGPLSPAAAVFVTPPAPRQPFGATP